MNRENVRGLIQEFGNKLFRVSFIKKDGSVRHMVARRGVRKNLKGGKNTVAEYSQYITLFDMKKAQYRNVNIDTIFEIKFMGFIYGIE